MTQSLPESDLANSARLDVRREAPRHLVVTLRGPWRVRPGLPTSAALEQALAEAPTPERVRFEIADLGPWDSSLPTVLFQCVQACRLRGVPLDTDGLPPGLRQLLALAEAVPESRDTRATATAPSWAYRTGERALHGLGTMRAVFTFVGECALAAVHAVAGRSRFRGVDALLAIQQTGPSALPIVLLINGLVGMILAFVGAVQLEQFGAAIYVANLVAVAMVREMGSIMTAIIMCGRTGAAFAAELGTMKVNEEIDALRSFGIAPMEFLVLPRVLALTLMMPLLVVFADALGILGGMGIALLMLDISPTQYLNQTVHAVNVSNFLIGIVKGGAFGALVGMTGCWWGLRCGNNAAAVGLATTAAVVTGITGIIVLDAIFAVLCHALKI